MTYEQYYNRVLFHLGVGTKLNTIGKDIVHTCWMDNESVHVAVERVGLSAGVFW